MQHQQRVVWPPSATLARAYLDQLDRGNGIEAQRAEAVTETLGRVDRLASGGDGATVVAELEELATQLESDAEEAIWLNVERLGSLADTLRGIATTLR